MSDEPSQSEIESRVDQLAREAGRAVRRAMPSHALGQVRRAVRRRRALQVAGVGAVGALLTIGIISLAGDDRPSQVTPATDGPPVTTVTVADTVAPRQWVSSDVPAAPGFGITHLAERSDGIAVALDAHVTSCCTAQVTSWVRTGTSARWQLGTVAPEDFLEAGMGGVVDLDVVGDQFVATGSRQDVTTLETRATLWVSADGTTWTMVDLGRGEARALAATPGGVLVAGTTGLWTAPRVTTNIDDWAFMEWPVDAGWNIVDLDIDPEDEGSIVVLAYSGGMLAGPQAAFVSRLELPPASGYLASEHFELPTTDAVSQLIVQGPRMVVTGQGAAGPLAWSSNDGGVTWQAADLPESCAGGYLGSAVMWGDIFAAACNRSPDNGGDNAAVVSTLISSSDGVSWSSVEDVPVAPGAGFNLTTTADGRLLLASWYTDPQGSLVRQIWTQQ